MTGMTEPYTIMKNHGVEKIEVEPARRERGNVRVVELGVAAKTLEIVGDGFDMGFIVVVQHQDLFARIDEDVIRPAIHGRTPHQNPPGKLEKERKELIPSCDLGINRSFVVRKRGRES